MSEQSWRFDAYGYQHRRERDAADQQIREAEIVLPPCFICDREVMGPGESMCYDCYDDTWDGFDDEYWESVRPSDEAMRRICEADGQDFAALTAAAGKHFDAPLDQIRQQPMSNDEFAKWVLDIAAQEKEFEQQTSGESAVPSEGTS